MNIQILGTGCPTCKKLFELTKQAVSELKLAVEVEYINDIEKIMSMGVMSSPVLAIDGKAVIAGQLPSLEKIKEILANQKDIIPEVKTGGCSCGGRC